MLNRVELINVMTSFRENVEDTSKYIKYLKELDDLFYGKEFKSDKRFVTYGRREFLLKEFMDALSNEDYTQAFYDLDDYINARTWIPMSIVSNMENPLSIIEKDSEYNKDGVVSLEEKEILVNMINDFINTLERKHK